jgi:hypothetical protein
MPGNGFEHACFISYKHPPKTAPRDHFYRRFAVEFRLQLEKRLATNVRTYLDEDADIGTSYPSELSQKLCKSVCMIAILVPEYPDSSWCRAEWDAMEKLEGKRLGAGKRGLIIPVALRRSPDEWNNLLKRKPEDFSKVVVPENQLGSVSNVTKIQRIAEKVAQLVSQVKAPSEDCGQFLLQLPGETLSDTPTFGDPNPFE